MAMKYSKKFVFLGSYFAMILMTCIACLFGYVAPNLISKRFTDLIATCLFFFFGIKILYDLIVGNDSEEEKEDVQKTAE
jgi:putative Ca2+/H+ antiporter (TMEM165/GDT1 family)